MFKYPFSGRGTMLMALLLAMAWWVIAIVGPVMAQAPELQISIIPGRQQVQPGETLTYTIQYTNSGAAVASNVTIIGALLPKEQVNAITGDYQSDDRESGVVTWNIGELAPETEDKKQLNVTIANNAAGELSINVEIQVDNEPIDSSLASVQVTSPAPETQPPESPEVTATPVISTPVPADTPTPVPADTATPPPTDTPTPVPTDTPTPLPSNTPTSTQTPTPSPTHTPTPVPTNTPTPTVVPPAPPQPLSAIDLLYYGLIFVVIFAAVALIVVGIIFILHRRKGTPPSSIESPTPTIPPPPSPPATSVTAYLECPARTTEPRRISLRNLASGGELIGRAMPETGITLRIDGTFPHWETVGRHHARIYRDSGTGKVIIEDTDSKNGVYVQGQRIAKLNLLKDGWQVAIGGVEFVYRESQAASLSSPDVEKGVANE